LERGELSQSVQRPGVRHQSAASVAQRDAQAKMLICNIIIKSLDYELLLFTRGLFATSSAEKTIRFKVTF
jgi:hypothetical protein